MSGDETVGQQQVPERRPGETIDPEPAAVAPRERDGDDRRETPEGVSLETGPRLTSNVAMLVIEAELVADGRELDNPAQPLAPSVADEFHERIAETDLEPAWLRPWEGDDE